MRRARPVQARAGSCLSAQSCGHEYDRLQQRQRDLLTEKVRKAQPVQARLPSQPCGHEHDRLQQRLRDLLTEKVRGARLVLARLAMRTRSPSRCGTCPALPWLGCTLAQETIALQYGLSTVLLTCTTQNIRLAATEGDNHSLEV